MSANQVQIRRDSNTNLTAATPAQGELGMDTTNTRIVIGDGTKAGGNPIPSWKDVQGNAFVAGTTTGSANAQTLTLAAQLQPSAYATHQQFSFIAGYTNTGATTLTVTALAAKTIKKVVAGSLTDLDAGDITAGRPYSVYYDGTYFVLISATSAGGVNPSSFEDATAGNYMTAIAFADTANNPPGLSYIKVAEIIAPRSGTYRIRIGIELDGTSYTLYGRSYVNGGAAGTEITSTGTRTFQNDDIAVNAGDLIQLYMKGSNAVLAKWDESPTGPLDFQFIALCEADPVEGGVLYTTQLGMV